MDIQTIGISVFLNGALVYLFREWISVRLKASIQHEYDQKLEAYKAKLEADKEVAIIDIKRSIDKEAALLSTANAAFAEGQKAAIERKLNAIDRLWQALLQFRNNLPPVLTFIDDVMNEDQYRELKPKYEALLGEYDKKKIEAMFKDKNKSTEEVRPYVGDKLWWLYFSYTSIYLRLLVMIHFKNDDSAVIKWYEDSMISDLINALLTAEETKVFNDMPYGKITWLRDQLEGKVLHEMQHQISGNELSIDSLDNQQIVEQTVSKMNQKSEKQMH